MQLMVAEMARRRGGILPLLQEAFLWRHGRMKDMRADAVAYNTQGRVPDFLQAYVRHIEAKQTP